MNTPKPPLAVSVIICTRNRADSLAITLECLASADRTGIRAEVVLVDNGSQDHTTAVVAAYNPRIPIRYVYEPTLGGWDKSKALNRALDIGELGEIVAILDDDMSPAPNWFQGVAAICARWPDRHIFTGDTYVIPPVAALPSWSEDPRLRNWVFSAPAAEADDRPLAEGSWFSGCHWWFRASVLASGKRFRDIYLTEADFMLDLAEFGFSGMACPDASAGHRIQPALLDPEVVLARARKWGKTHAAVQLDPYRPSVPRARQMSSRPLVGRLFCSVKLAIWSTRYLIFEYCLTGMDHFAGKVATLERMNRYLEYLRTVSRMPEYSIWRGGKPTEAQK
jgi:glycosyltransferase involved in cell wall biosynthesis